MQTWTVLESNPNHYVNFLLSSFWLNYQKE